MTTIQYNKVLETHSAILERERREAIANSNPRVIVIVRQFTITSVTTILL